MSLLRTQERWGVTCEHREEFERGSLAILGPTRQLHDSSTIVFTASTAGIVRAYSPELDGCEEHELLVETDLKCPVLQIEIGRFVDFGKSSLVVLHSHKIGIFGFHFQDSSGRLWASEPAARNFNWEQRWGHFLIYLCTVIFKNLLPNTAS